MKDTALVLLGHGSSKHASSSMPCRLHADTIRRMDVFHSVHCGFLKETPFIEECLDHVAAEKVIILPNFLAEGYYTNKVIPEKLQLEKQGRQVTYLKPLGLQPFIQDVIIDLTERAMKGWNPEETTLMLLGHGSTKSATSKNTMLAHIEALRKKTDFAQITDLWLEEPPFINDWQESAQNKQVLFLPYLIADGQHGGWDMPEMIGIQRDGYDQYKAHSVGGYSVKLTPALGKSQLMVELILKLATQG
ncbi:MAG: sirohydrochlorin cobaltochelatase [Cryomorphaceae bacterium]|jgi:sirohydrochlorin cobaltochelatase